MLQDSPIYAYFPATDVSRARAFYEKKLGLRPKAEVAGGIVYEFGKGTAAFLYETPNAGTSKASQAFWEVEDVEREVAALRERGVEFIRYDDMPGKKHMDGLIVEDGGAKAAWFEDPDGNILAIIESVD